MRRRDVSKALLASAAGSTLLTQQAEAQTCSAPCFPRTTAETGVTLADQQYQELSNARRYGALGDAVTEDHHAIQREIDVAQAVPGGGDIDLGRGRYRLGAGLTITGNRVHLVGRGRYATELLYMPSSNGTCLKFINGSTTINQGGVRGVAIRSDDSSYTKTAIEVVDMSGFVFDDIAIGGSVAIGGSGFWSGGTGSIGIRTRGRDTTGFSNITAFCDKPLVISPNPHGSISLDHVNFHNFFMGAAGFPVVTVEPTCTLTQISFTGYQAWVLGTGGLYWVDITMPGASNGLVLENVRYENATDATKYFVHIDVASDLQALSIRGGQAGFCRGFYLRGVNRAHFDTFFYSDTGREALNANTTVDELVFTNCLWNTGSTASLTGLKIINKRPTTVSGPLPNNGMITVAPAASDFEAIESTIGSGVISVAADSKAVIGTASQLGFVVVADDTTQTTAFFELRGTNHNTAEVSDPSGFFTATANNANTYNICWDATALSGAGGYVIQNKRAATAAFRVMRLGRA